MILRCRPVQEANASVNRFLNLGRVAGTNALSEYRRQNTRASAHFFTIYENEKDTVIQNYDWFLFEGISFYAYPRQSLN